VVCVCLILQPWLLWHHFPFGTVVACWRRIIQSSRTFFARTMLGQRIGAILISRINAESEVSFELAGHRNPDFGFEIERSVILL